MNFQRINSSNQDFIDLVKKLDAYLAITDEDEHDFYDQFNSIESLKHCMVAYDGERAVACGAIKPYNEDLMEVKRMYTLPESRGRGIARKLLQQLEQWATELGYNGTILETGRRQVEAVIFYEKCGYSIIPNYGQYEGMENSICFQKMS